MTKVLITGMSGTGKSTVLEILGARGHRTVDTDTDRWSHWVTLPDGSLDWIWREQAIADLLTGHHAGKLFVAGCKSNQGKFYPQFDHVVLLERPRRRAAGPHRRADQQSLRQAARRTSRHP